MPVTVTSAKPPEGVGPSTSCWPVSMCPATTVPAKTVPTPATLKVWSTRKWVELPCWGGVHGSASVPACAHAASMRKHETASIISAKDAGAATGWEYAVVARQLSLATASCVAREMRLNESAVINCMTAGVWSAKLSRLCCVPGACYKQSATGSCNQFQTLCLNVRWLPPATATCLHAPHTQRN